MSKPFILLTLMTWLAACCGPVAAQNADVPPTSSDEIPDIVHVTVSGEVNAPGRYAVPASNSVVDLLSQAGGVTDMAADTVYLSRSEEVGHGKRYPINLKDLRRSGAKGWLREGDTVVVPRAEQFSISGEVHQPGTYRLDSAMTVRQAIVKAGELTAFGSYRTVVVRRKDSDGVVRTIKVMPDDLVEPGDEVRVKIDYFGS
jgi:polysaccharide export outer membrane protein